jgi:SAM-dependent methyltransferase
VGIVGLGIGTLAAFAQKGDVYRFYEINPLVVDVANQAFTYLSTCQGKVETVMGDARLSMEREPPQNYDVLVIDAFSSDAIPVHLLTREAFRVYFKHLKPDGFLVVHVSNRYLDLESVVERVATDLGKQSRMRITPEDPENALEEASWAMVTGRPGYFESPGMESVWEEIPVRRDVRVWTDDYSNLLKIMR